MSLNIFVSSGGGITVGASFGAEAEGERQNKFKPSQFTHFVGTSAGALDATLTANGWTGQQKQAFLLDTPWMKLFKPPFVPFAIRQALALRFPISLDRMAAFIRDLNLKSHPGLILNAVDMKTNQTVYYCQALPPWADLADSQVRWEVDAFNRLGLEQCIVDSMSLPGLTTKRPWMGDGGFRWNGLSEILPFAERVTFIKLGYSGEARYGVNEYPSTPADKAFYAFDYKSYGYASHIETHFTNLVTIKPKAYRWKTTQFDYSRAELLQMFEEAAANSSEQWAGIT